MQGAGAAAVLRADLVEVVAELLVLLLEKHILLHGETVVMCGGHLGII